jgi:hypothetical protein
VLRLFGIRSEGISGGGGPDDHCDRVSLRIRHFVVRAFLRFCIIELGALLRDMRLHFESDLSERSSQDMCSVLASFWRIALAYFVSQIRISSVAVTAVLTL